MSLTFWNRRRREAAQAGEERDPEEVAEVAEATAGEPGTEGVEGHTGTDHTEPPFGAPEEPGEEVDASEETHEDAAAETDPEGATEEAPKGNASRDEWAAYALRNGKTEEDLKDLNRDAIRDLFA